MGATCSRAQLQHQTPASRSLPQGLWRCLQSLFWHTRLRCCPELQQMHCWCFWVAERAVSAPCWLPLRGGCCLGPA